MTTADPHPHTEPYDVLALGASAGGHAAVAAVLQALPPDFAVPIVVMQHLAPDAQGTVDMYRRLVPYAVEPLLPHSRLAPGTVLICPPRTFVDLLPDGTFALAPNARGAVDKPIDRLLASLARSFGHRAIGVILTGMGADGALGARELHLAGGRIIVQNEASAEFPDMPRAAVGAGAADLVVPLQDIGQVIAELAAGTPQPLPRSEVEAVRRVFGDEGAVAALARTVDWAQTELGPVRDWSPALRSVVRLAVDSPYPVALWLGKGATLIVNEAALPWQGSLFPAGFAQPYPTTAPNRYAVYRQSIARAAAGQWVMHEAYGSPLAEEEQGSDAWWNVVFTPIREADGRVIGIHIAWQERTAAVLAARRLQLLNRLAAAETADNRRAALAAALAILEDCPDIPFAAAWLADAGSREALLAGTAGVAEGDPLAPRQIATHSTWEPWPLQQVLERGEAVVVADLAQRFPGRFAESLAAAPGAGATGTPAAVLCPLTDRVEGRVIGVVVLGANPRLALDEPYQNFLTLVGETIGAKAAAAQARQRENERLERLAELDRTKTEFFANISHEFRTPLTLMLAPLEDLLRHRDELPPGLVDEVEVAANNSRRLLRLVNSLLDFSQIETRRQGANFAPTDLGALTTDIASAFRSAVEAAGIRFRVECSPTLPPVWVDREMWEKIVSNLLSNAFKFTFEGEIAVELHALTLHAELIVRDTGIGIPEHEMADIFKRFHRVRGARARTVEGSGIGLAIVDDLVTRLGGQLRARSKEHAGTEFTIWIPYKSPRAKAESTGGPGLGAVAESAGGPLGEPLGEHAFAGQLAEEAWRWVAAERELPPEVMDDLLGPDQGAGYAQGLGHGETRLGTILVADDNADMRGYLQRLLGARWQVELAPDGAAALAAALDPARGAPPDVILADVMMPRLDGFGLTQAVRATPQLADTPVVLLTARTGEAAAIQGLQAGADDYIAKPFSPRELLARIQGVYERGRAQGALRKSEARQAYLVQLGDGLRPLADPVQIQEAAAQIAMDYYGADRCYYCEVQHEQAIIHRDAARAGLPSVAGVYPLADLPMFVAAAEAGAPIVVADVAASDVLDEDLKQLCIQLEIIAYINVPVMKEGRYVGNLCITQAVPRRWTELEVELAVETAERTWAAVVRAGAEAALRASEARLAAEVAVQTAQVRELVTRLTMSEQEERRRISSLLHDDVQQRLFSFLFQLAALRQALDAGEGVAARAIIGAAEAGLQEAIQVTRALSVDLSPPVLHDEGLAEALRWLAAQMQQHQGLVVDVQAEAGAPRLGEELRVLLFQAVRELLFNVARHGGVNRAEVTIGWSGERLRITVCDEGQGFAPEAPGNGGQGLRRIEQRMKLLGGGMEIAAAPGQGTCVTLVAPVAASSVT